MFQAEVLSSLISLILLYPKLFVTDVKFETTEKSEIFQPWRKQEGSLTDRITAHFCSKPEILEEDFELCLILQIGKSASKLAADGIKIFSIRQITNFNFCGGEGKTSCTFTITNPGLPSIFERFQIEF